MHQFKIDQHLIIQNLMKFFFIHLLLVLISVVEVVTLFISHMLKFMLQKQIKIMNVNVINLMPEVDERSS